MSGFYESERGVSAHQRARLGVFGFLATEPLTATLGDDSFVRASPVETPDLLANGTVDAAMVEAIDILTLPPEFSILHAGAWAMRRSSLSIRLFAHCHPEQIQRIYVDDNSHQASALVRILWALDYGTDVQVIPFAPEYGDPPDDAQATVILGDRPVATPPICFDYQIDLVARWHRHTGLPLPWAFWVTCDMAVPWGLERRLAQAATHSQSNLRAMAGYVASDHDWPVDLAERELARDAEYRLTPDLLDGLDELAHLARLFGILSPAQQARGA
jgi:predicted solute-binding protein